MTTSGCGDDVHGAFLTFSLFATLFVVPGVWFEMVKLHKYMPDDEDMDEHIPEGWPLGCMDCCFDLFEFALSDLPILILTAQYIDAMEEGGWDQGIAADFSMSANVINIILMILVCCCNEFHVAASTYILPEVCTLQLVFLVEINYVHCGPYVLPIAKQVKNTIAKWHACAHQGTSKNETYVYVTC